MFSELYKNKKVLVTGHTGFKGSWLVTWLIKLGANVIGVSKDIPTAPSMFEELKLEEQIVHYEEDIRDLNKLIEIFSKEKPDFLFHLAAQPLVSVSYSNPIETISTNVMGTTNILEVLKIVNHKCTTVIITSDKAYNNVEQVWGYKEDDHLGGKDIYSGSKGAAELIIKSYYHSFFKQSNSNVKLAVGRAGNVIGGGDWAKDRIVVDCIKAWSNKESVEIRNPESTRPWQHVLEPLSGYLTLGKYLYNNDDFNGMAFNFGPNAEDVHTVQELLKDLSTYWNIEKSEDAFKVNKQTSFKEANLLKLNCDKAQFFMKWKPVLSYKDTIKFTSEWYFEFYNKKENSILDKTMEQINQYELNAQNKGIVWTE